MKGRMAVAAAVVAGFVVMAGTALGASGLVNGTFDSNTNGWTAAGSARVEWVMAAHGSAGASGAASITAINLSAGRSGSGAYQCVPVEPNTHMLLSSLAGAPPNQGRRAFPGYRIAFYSSPGCTGITPNLAIMSWPDIDQAMWYHIWFVVRTPADAGYAWVGLMTWAEALAPGAPAVSEATVLWDDVTFSKLPVRGVAASVSADK